MCESYMPFKSFKKSFPSEATGSNPINAQQI